MLDTLRRAVPASFRFTPVACVVMAALRLPLAHAQTEPADSALSLKPSSSLLEQLPAAANQQLPTFLSGDQASGQLNLTTQLDGSAVLRKHGLSIHADHLNLYQPDALAHATGNVLVNQAGNTYTGPELDINVDTFQGFFTQPNYRLLSNGGYGKADRMDFIDDKQAIAHNVTYTTCERKPGPSWLPDWMLTASSMEIDQDTQTGTAKDAKLSFKNVPILYAPSVSFPLSDERKSGFLPPTYTLDNTSGLGLTIPYYFNLAPNRDLTVAADTMTQRGVNFTGDFRYLENDYKGEDSLAWMPADAVRGGAKRWGVSALQTGNIDTGLSAIGKIGLNLNINRVSDNNYWSDFPESGSSLTQRQLQNQLGLNWGRGNFSFNATASSWQTLQDPASPIVPPYDRLPELKGTYTRNDVNGFDGTLVADYTRFSADRTLTLQPNADRTYLAGQISRPWITPGWYITPKLMLNATSYSFDAPLPLTGATNANRALPTLSLDSGLTFERSTQLWGRNFTQTLEPRAFYVYTPFRDQSALPLYDTGANDFNFATIFTENPYSGNDRIADNNLLTLGATTRFLDPDTGAEGARLGIAQQVRFQQQRVVLPGQPPNPAGLSDLLIGGSINWNKTWAVDSNLQFNERLGYSDRASMGVRYSPTNYRVLNLNYSYERGVIDQYGVSWQWPLNDLWGDRGQDRGTGRGLGPGNSGGRWYSVGRLNYSVSGHNVVDAILGVEYDAGCWIGRVVLDRLTTATSTALSSSSTKFFFQIEFYGLGKLGSNPIQTLRQNIPRYQPLRETVSPPSQYSNYD